MSKIEARMEANEVVLFPIDTTQLRALGCKVTASTIPSTSSADEKGELQGVRLQTGKEVTVAYLINGRSAQAIYRVIYIQPPNSYVGNATVMEIRAERQNGQSLLPTNRVSTDEHEQELLSTAVFRATLQRELNLTQADLNLAREVGLPATALEVRAESLRKSLQAIF